MGFVLCFFFVTSMLYQGMAEPSKLGVVVQTCNSWDVE